MNNQHRNNSSDRESLLPTASVRNPRGISSERIYGSADNLNENLHIHMHESNDEEKQSGQGKRHVHHFLAQPTAISTQPSAINRSLLSPGSNIQGGSTVIPIESSINKNVINSKNEDKNSNKGKNRVLYYVVYAFVNLIISAPGLYGYTAVIFNHPIFSNYMNALSKLVIFSSCIHQLGFCLFSSLDFAIGTVQDAGLIFLSSMANDIANEMLKDNHTDHEIVSTTLVLLSLGTAVLGLVLVGIGRAKWADAVSYLPIPVVGGYLAFIGYFCIQAGVALCISRPLVVFGDWKYVFEPNNLLLAAPGLLTGLVLTLTTRLSKNEALLPLLMVSIPALFYLAIYWCGIDLDEARESGWVGETSPPVPVSELLKLVNFTGIRWDLIAKILPTWVGMLFVVAFASCLDVAAISIDMGQALDTNRELTTVGICNIMSGLSLGFTGSYIFSQTIFTYRTGIHSKWIGVLIMIGFLYIVVSPVNMLEIAPLFFLGSTLIFIGYDLVYEWLWEIRHQIFLSEYVIVWLTFVFIQLLGMDVGIVLGVLVAILEQVILTAQTSSVVPVKKRSRAVWTPNESQFLSNFAYNNYNAEGSGGPQIVTLEIYGTVFFGSSLMLLNRLSDEIGVNTSSDGSINDSGNSSADNYNSRRSPYMSPRRILTQGTTPHQCKTKPSKSLTAQKTSTSTTVKHQNNPSFVVIDLMHISHLDASATRGLFLQLTKACAKANKIVCASGATPRIEWMFRNHEVSYKTVEEESQIKTRLQSSRNSCSNYDNNDKTNNQEKCKRILLFVTVLEALEFCENALINQKLYSRRNMTPLFVAESNDNRNLPLLRPLNKIKNNSSNESGISNNSNMSQVAIIFSQQLRLNGNEDKEKIVLLQRLSDNKNRYFEEFLYQSGDVIFQTETYSNSFYVVLEGAVANYTGSAKISYRQKLPIVSGAGYVDDETMYRVGSKSNLMDVSLIDEIKLSGGESNNNRVSFGGSSKKNQGGKGGPHGSIVAALWAAGSIFGYLDFLLDRQRSLRAVATKNNTKVVSFTRAQMKLIQKEDPDLETIIQRVLLHACTLDLANCT